MLEKTLYNQLFSRSFSLPVEVNYWDGTTKQYGDTDTPPQIKINIHEEIPMKEITSNASLALGDKALDDLNISKKRLSKMAAKERKTYETKKQRRYPCALWLR